MAKYYTIFRLAFTHTLKNYKALIGLSIFLITCLIIFANLWKIAATRMGVIDLDPSLLLWYIAFNEWVLIATHDVQEDIEDDLRSGKLAYLLPRPISYLGSKFFDGLGILSANLIVLGVVAFVFTYLATKAIPFDLKAFPITIAIGFFAGIVALIFQMIIGVSAFWISEVSPFYWLWEKLLFIFGGLMLPLTVYPMWLQKMALFTPFPAILGARSALALGFTLGEALSIILSLTLWAVIGITCLTFLYRRGLKIINIEGC